MRLEIALRVRQTYWRALAAQFLARLYREDSNYFRQIISYHEARFHEGKTCRSGSTPRAPRGRARARGGSSSAIGIRTSPARPGAGDGIAPIVGTGASPNRSRRWTLRPLHRPGEIPSYCGLRDKRPTRQSPPHALTSNCRKPADVRTWRLLRAISATWGTTQRWWACSGICPSSTATRMRLPPQPPITGQPKRIIAAVRQQIVRTAIDCRA